MNKPVKLVVTFLAFVMIMLTLGRTPQGALGAPLAQGSGGSDAPPTGLKRIPDLLAGHKGARPASFWAPVRLAVPDASASQAASPEDKDTAAPLVSPEGWQTIKSEGFEGTFPSSGWSVWDESADGYERYWGKEDYKPRSGSWSAWPASGGAQRVDASTGRYPHNMDTWMVYGPFDLSNATDAQTAFYLWRQIELEWDYIFFGVSPDGNYWDGYTWDGEGGWTEIVVSLAGFTGDNSVWVGWYFHSDGSVAQAGPFVDDITISQRLPDPPAPPVVSISRSGSDVVLTWANVAGASHYEVWQSVNAPYFAPGADCAASPACTVVSATTHRHTGALGNTANNYSYVVLAVNAGGRSGVSNRVGEFDYSLAPGG